MCRSELCTSTPAGGAMSAAVTAPGPCLRRYITTGSSCSLETTRPLMLRMISVMSSLTPGIVENSCSTPSTRRLVTAAPGMLESSVRRSELPRVYPKPGSSGSMTKRERASVRTSSLRVGRCAISTVSFLPTGDRYLTPRDSAGHDSRDRRTSVRADDPLAIRMPGGWLPSHPASRSVLRVELDDPLLLYLRVDDLTRRQGVDEDLHLRRDGFNPGRHRALAGLCSGDDKGRHLHGLATNVDDVVLGHPEAGDVHLVPVDHEVAMTNQLACHVTGGGEAGPLHDVVQTGLQDAQQVLAGLTRATVRLLVVTAELLLQDAVDTGGLLLLTHLEQVLTVLGPRAAVHARGIRAKLDRALRGVALGSLEVQLGLLTTAAPAVGAGITRHSLYLLLLRVVRRVDAWTGGRRCAALVSRH